VDTPANVHVAGTQGFANSRQRDTKRLQPPRVDDHAVLLDEAADARDFGNALRLRNAVLRADEGPWRPLAYLFLVADCALRSASSAHAIHAPAISINIALSFSDARCAKRRHSAAYCRKRSASLSMTRFTFLDVPMFRVANREL
jgi:hypothetical protein